MIEPFYLNGNSYLFVKKYDGEVEVILVEGVIPPFVGFTD